MQRHDSATDSRTNSGPPRSRIAHALRGNTRRFVTAAVISAFMLEFTGHLIDELWNPPFVSNVFTLVGIIVLMLPALLFIASVPGKPYVRAGLLIAGICIALTIVLDMTMKIEALNAWPVIGSDSVVRSNLRWFALVLGLFLLFGTLYYTIGDLVDSRTRLQAERKGLLKEMRQRKRAEKNAQAARDYAENLIRTANVIVIGLDNKANLKVFNETAEQITGYTREELEKIGWFNTLMPPDRYSRVRREILEQFKAGVPKHLEGPIRTKSGEDRQIAWSNSEVREGGKVTGTISFGLDITDRKREEADLLRSSRLATLGVVAAGLAHEIGNPLASLSTRLRLMEETEDPAFWRESIGLLHRQLTRISHIVHGVSRFSRPPRLEPAACDVNALVADALDIVRFHEGARHCQIGMELAPHSPSVVARADQLAQVFLNMGLNALEAMPEGGALTVSTGISGDHVQILFSDSGTGLTDEARKEMFNAFYTSKPDGMGLGLSIAKSIITGHNGRIEFGNNEEGGAWFRVLLPLMDTPSPLAGGVSGVPA